MAVRGARYIHVLVPCPLGWGSASNDTIRLARLAKETGLFPVFEAEHGEITSVSKIRRRQPVEEYLRPQGRYGHLFGSSARPDIVERIQAIADRNIRRFGLLDADSRAGPPTRGALMDKPFAITLDVGSSLANKTGILAGRAAASIVDRLPPCNDACPAGENIQGWLYHAEEGDYEPRGGCWSRTTRCPAVMGRVCYHPCETACNRVQVDEAVGINAVERFLGDEAIARGWELECTAPPSGKRVLVVGAGPAGLSAAYQLRRRGHAVTIYEAGPLPGGMMRYGIPRYRLPRDVLQAEIDRILALGVTLEVGRTVTDVAATMRSDGFDAAFLAVGAEIGKRAYLPAGDSARVFDAVSLLRGMEGAEPPMLGRRVAVYGGGDTAMDAARTARRLGATDAVVVYRRTRDRMPAHDIEVEEALEEGVQMKWLSTIKEVGDTTLVLEKMKLDEHGFPQPTGELEELDADALVLALGQESDLSPGARGARHRGRRRRRAGGPRP